MHRGVVAREALQPDFFHREDQHRCKPCGQTVEQDIQHRARGTAAQSIAITVERILADIEVERREIDRGKGKDRLEHTLEVKARKAVAHHHVEFRHPVQHPPLQFWHVRRIDAVCLAEIIQRAEHIAHGITQAAIAVGHAFEDLIPDPLVGGVIGLRHPKPQNIRAILLHNFLGYDGVADGFGHLHALRVQRETVCHHVAVRRATRSAHRLQQRGVKPPAVLVGAFHVNVCDAVLRPVFPVAQGEGMGRAAIEPDVENVSHLIELCRIDDALKEAFFRAFRIPGIRAFGLEGLNDTLIDLRIAQQEALIRRSDALAHKTGQRHAPGALAAEHPVGPCFHHRMQAVAARFRHPIDLVDASQCAFADGLAVLVQPVADNLVDRGKPLRRVAVDHRRLGAPAMRVAVLDLATRQQPADLNQLVDDRAVGVALFAVRLEDCLAAKERQIIAETPVFHDVIGDDLRQHAQIAIKLIFFEAVGRCAMHKARTLIRGHEIRRPEIAQIVPFAVGSFGPGQRV